MVRRILNILDECKTMWPLASRWYDHLDKFYNSKAAVVAAETEGSMADSVRNCRSYPTSISTSNQILKPYISLSAKANPPRSRPGRKRTPAAGSATYCATIPGRRTQNAVESAEPATKGTGH